jgi:CheY-like chemotaxis protein
MKLTEARVLVVDDEVALREMFAKWLRASGCPDVRMAANGEEALAAIQMAPIDVLITDVRMPVMDGVTLVRRLAEEGERIACIIFVSAFSDIDPREMYDLGVEAFLAKPFRLEELSTALDHAIADRPTLWKTPMTIPPRQSVCFDVDPPDGPASQELNMRFRLGRGGFSAHSPEPLGLGKIGFRCCASPGRPELMGQGYVRWRSRVDHSVGIEFAYLDSPGREWVVEELFAESPRSFIPAL